MASVSSGSMTTMRNSNQAPSESSAEMTKYTGDTHGKPLQTSSRQASLDQAG
jgi:hypothetical protein